MKKLLAVFLLIGMIVVVVGGYVIKNWDPYRNVPNVTLDLLNAGETDWYTLAIQDYRILISVEFGSEQRRYEVFVQNGLFSEASSARWDETAGKWGAFSPAPEEEAGFFTVPGLFALLRKDLLNQEVDREALRLAIGANKVPEVLFLGRIIQDGLAVDGTELEIKVLEFEALE